jgi:hypothetical protein
MTNPLVRTALRNSLAQVRHVRPARTREGYTEVEREVGVLAPQIALHSPAPDLQQASWTLLRETLVASGNADRTTKEAVAAIVALGNGSGYLVELHTAVMDALAEARVLDDPDYDHRVRAVADWARATRFRATAAKRGLPEHSGELTGVLVAAHYFTRMANVFLPDSHFPGVPAAARTRALALLGRALLPAATAWHAPGPADALSLAGEAFAAAGERSVPPAVRDLVRAELSTWDGGPVDRGWVDSAVRGLPFAERPAGRLALLAALSSSAVDDRVVADYRIAAPEDRALVELVAWGSFAAASEIGSWTVNARIPEPVGG